MCLVENAQHEKYLHTFNSGLICVNKAAHQLLCSSLLFCFRELNLFLEISVQDPQKILGGFRAETVNLHLSSTVLWGLVFKT